MRQIYWLLEVTIDGRLYRWATQRVTVTTADVDDLEYEGGLGDLSLAVGDPASVTVTDPSVDWPTLGPELPGGRAVVLRWEEGTDYEAAEAYSIGEATEVEYGGRFDPVAFTVDQAGDPRSLGHQLPDPLARVDDATWPISANHEVGDVGMYYPIILGYPGYRGSVTATDPTSYPVVPVPVAEWSDTTTPVTASIVVAEDIDAQITEVTLRADDLDLQQDETVVSGTDLLDRIVRRAQITDSEAMYPAARDALYFAGYYPDGGGGVARAAYDVIVYLLRRWGPESVDWGRLPTVADALAGFQVDSWIDQPVSDPWAWLESAILPDLPVEIRVSQLGRYLVHRRYVSDPSRQVGTLNPDLGDCVRVSSVRRDDVGPSNEFTAYYRANREGDWLGKLILTGDPDEIAAANRFAPNLTTSTDTQTLAVARHGLCLASATRYGVRQATPVEIDWTWDEGTVLRVLDLRAQREALPARLVDYRLEDGEDLAEGDELLLTDAELGWTSQVAIVDAPPVRDLHTTTITLRLPEAG
jgi:hypothetical protein